jgi:hypothetical protein
MAVRRSITVDLTGPASHAVDPGLSRLFWIGPAVPAGMPGCAVPRDQRLNWPALDALGTLGEILYDGADPGFVDYLRGRPQVRTVDWTPAPLTDLDLSDTHVAHLRLRHGGGRLTVTLGAATTGVGVQGSTTGVTLRAAHPLSLGLSEVAGPGAIAGFGPLFVLSLYRCTDLRLVRLREYGMLRQLSVAESAVADIEELAGFPDLRILRFHECYDFDADRFPTPAALPALTTLEFSGIRKQAAEVMRERWGDLPGLRITDVRTDAWLLKHQDSPFRAWADDDLPHARAAGTAWSSAITALGKLAADDLAGATEVLHAFVAKFNRMDRREGLDTLQVEHVGEAYDRLAAMHPATSARAEVADRFDEWREF